MIYVITAIHVIVSLFLIIVVLLQRGKSTDIAAAFGGGLGSQTAFGPRGAATVLTKATTYAAIIFMLTSITLSIYASRRRSGGSVLEGAPQSQQQQVPPAQQPASNPTTPAPNPPQQ